MLRLAHLSDLHYTTERRTSVRETLESVRRDGADHLIITGDLTDDGSDVQMRGLFSLLAEAGYGDSRSLTVIPGNHDLFGFIYRTFDQPGNVVGRVRGLRSLAASVKTLWSFRRQLVKYNIRDYQHSLSRFLVHFEPAFDDCLPVRGARFGFPFVKILPGNVALIGIDSNFYLPRLYGSANILLHGRRVIRTHDITLLGENLSGSTGWVDEASLDAALTLPEIHGCRKILLVHHCLYDLSHLISLTSRSYAMEMRLANRDSVASVLSRRGVDLALHGHEHALDAYRIAGGNRVVNSGGAYGGRFHRLDISNHAIHVAAFDRNEGESQSSYGREIALP